MNETKDICDQAGGDIYGFAFNPELSKHPFAPDSITDFRYNAAGKWVACLNKEYWKKKGYPVK